MEGGWRDASGAAIWSVQLWGGGDGPGFNGELDCLAEWLA